MRLRLEYLISTLCGTIGTFCIQLDLRGKPYRTTTRCAVPSPTCTM